MPYSEQTWNAGRVGNTPVNVARLQHMEDGIEAAAVVADVGTPGTATGDAIAAAIASHGGGGAPLTVATTVTTAGALVTGKHNPVDATSGALTMTLPTGASSGTMLSVEKVDASVNAVTVSGNLRGVSAQTITLVWQRETVVLVADSTGSWWPVAGHKTKTALDAAYALPSQTGNNGKLLSTNGSVPSWVTSSAGRATFDFDGRDYSLVSGDGTTSATDNTTALNNLITAANTAYVSTGRVQSVFVPAGKYRLATQVTMKSGVRMYGAGQASTILYPEGANSAFGATTSSGSPLTDVAWIDLTVDGVNQTGTATGTKGFYIVYMLRPTWLRVTVKNTIATGFGCDSMVDYACIDCLADSCGRGYAGSSGGFSGFGVGTGTYQDENGVHINCVARNNGNYGIFWEKQSGYAFRSRHHKAIGCHSYGNRIGFGDKGIDRLIVEGCTSIANTVHGFFVDQTFDAVNPGGFGLVTDSVFADNGDCGIDVKGSVGGYVIRDNRITNNTKNGIKYEGTAGAGHVIENNDIYLNLNGGVFFASTASVSDTHIVGNRIWANHLTTNPAQTPKDGINIACSTTRVHIERNWVYDNQGTKTQQYGLNILTGTTQTDLLVKDNDFRNNLTGAATNAGTLAGATIRRNNLGWVDGPTTVTPGASPYTYTAGFSPEVVYLEGGTVSSITKGGVTLRTGTPATIELAPSEAIVITYTVVPTMAVDRL